MDFTVKLFLNGKELREEDIQKIAISSKVVDRIVNSIYESANQTEAVDSTSSSEGG